MNQNLNSIGLIILFSAYFLTQVSGQSGTWVNKAPMPISRSDHSANTIGNQIIVCGGCIEDQICPLDSQFCYCPNITANVEAYQPMTDQWITLPSMPLPRFRHSTAVVGQKLYVFGGRDVNDNIMTSVDVYDDLKNSWETLNANSSVWVNATSDLVGVSLGTTVYAIGGYSQNYDVMRDVWMFDTVMNTWSKLSTSLNINRGDACGVTIDNMIYVFGGFSDNFCSPLDSLEVYNPVTNTWQIKSKLHNPRADLACGVQHNEFHAIGGERKSSPSACSIYDIPIRDVEHYHPTSDSWTEETALNNDRFRFASAAHGITFYIFGGQGPYVNGSAITYPVLNVVQAWEDNTVDPESSGVGQILISFALLAVILAH